MKKRNKRQILIAILAAILALMMVLPMVLMAVSYLSAGATSSGEIRGEIDALKEKTKELADRKDELDGRLAALHADKSQALSRKGVVEQQIAVSQETIANLTDLIAQYDRLIAEKEREIADKKAEEEARFDRFRKQVRLMEEEGAVSYWTILFSADSFTDLLDRVNLVNDIADYNQKVCDELEAAQAALEEARKELEEAQAETEGLKAEQEAVRVQLWDQENQVQALIDQIAGDEYLTKRALDELAEAADAMDEEIAKKEKELEEAIAEERRKASNKYQFDPGSGFYWPLPAHCVTVTSFYGPRSDPFTGAYSNHTGTDIAAPRDTPIYAAHGGVVLTSTYAEWSYGNYVVVSRGDGVTTLYAHMNSRAVQAGDVVEQGQVIGYVGTTGRSTGNHLHLELRINNERQDALQYYPSVSWINATGFSYE